VRAHLAPADQELSADFVSSRRHERLEFGLTDLIENTCATWAAVLPAAEAARPGRWGDTTIERILPVRMDAQRRKDMPSVAMVLIIDRSGSMTGLPIEMAKAACKATVTTLQGDDLVEVIAFDSTPIRYVKMQPARYRSRIQNDILRIQPGGGTEIFPALDMGYQDISVVQARKKHAILLTDGRSPTQGLKDLVQAMIAENITLTSVGLGEGTDQELLRMLADTGGGRFHFVPDPNSLPKIHARPR
jgi:Mg-chelatase subunit ChlD